MNRSIWIVGLAVLLLGGVALSGAIAQDGAPPIDAAPAAAQPELDELPLTRDSEHVDSNARYNKWTALVASITIFVLAIFVGFEIITKVPPTLHTPLMSGSNAISGISIVGALLASSTGEHWFAALLGFLALVLATTNVVGGYLVTHRMLSMFQSKR